MGRGRRKLLGLVGMLIILIVVIISQVYSYIKTYLTLHLKYVLFIVCQLYFNEAVPFLNPLFQINRGSLEVYAGH